MPGFRDDKDKHLGPLSWEREAHHLAEDIKRLEGSIEANKAITVDLQVRVAQLEAIEPIGKDEFDPIRRLVWGFVSTVLVVVIVALLAVVINKSGGSITVKPL